MPTKKRSAPERIMTERTYLKRLRKQKGYTGAELAEASGVPYTTLSYMERGRRERVYVTDIEALAYALGIKPVVLLQMELDYLNGEVMEKV